jgi:hypothetical protein
VNGSYEFRQQTIHHIAGALESIIMEPPRMSDGIVIDAGKLDAQVQEVKPYFLAYRDVSGVFKNHFKTRDMQPGERADYFKAQFFFDLLTTFIDVAHKDLS